MPSSASNDCQQIISVNLFKQYVIQKRQFGSQRSMIPVRGDPYFETILQVGQICRLRKTQELSLFGDRSEFRETMEHISNVAFKPNGRQSANFRHDVFKQGGSVPAIRLICLM